MSELKQVVSPADTLDKLDIRLGRIVRVEVHTDSPKKSYKLTVDFGKFGQRVTIGRFTEHLEEILVGNLVVGVLNFPERQIGSETSQFLCLGVQFPKAESGEATPLIPLADGAKIGGKVF